MEWSSINWALNDGRPIYLQLAEHIRIQIISGELTPGERLPSVRDLALEAAVNPNTMQKALSELEREELVYSNRTVGRYITESEETIQKLRQQFVLDKLQDFLATVRPLGYSPREISRMILEECEKE